MSKRGERRAAIPGSIYNTQKKRKKIGKKAKVKALKAARKLEKEKLEKMKKKWAKEQLELAEQKKFKYVKKTSEIFSAAKRIKTSYEVVDSNEIERDISSCLYACFIKLNKDSDNIDKLKWDIWHLRSDIINAIIPFNSESYSISQRFASIKRKSNQYPSIAHEINALEPNIEKILSHSFQNEKEKMINNYIRNASNKKRYGLLLNSQEGSYYKKDMIPVVENTLNHINLFNNFEFFSSQRDIHNYLHDGKVSAIDRLIIPSGGKYINYMEYLYYSGFTENIHFLLYDYELLNPFLKKPLARHLPTVRHGSNLVGCFPEDRVKIHDYTEQKSNFFVGVDDNFNDQWLNSDLPENILSSLSDYDSESTVNAHFLMLTKGRKIFLRKEHKVYEVTDFLAHRTDQLREREVRHLKVGDLFLWGNTSVDYVNKKTKTLLEESGKALVYDAALKWKPCLGELLHEKGARYLLNKINQIQEKYKLVKYKHTNSLWNWTTEDVLRPDKPETFQGLIEIMSEGGFLKPVIGDVSTDVFFKTTSKAIRELIWWKRKARILIKSELNKIFEDCRDSGEAIKDGSEVSIGNDEASLFVNKIINISPESHLIKRTDLGKIITNA